MSEEKKTRPWIKRSVSILVFAVIVTGAYYTLFKSNPNATPRSVVEAWVDFQLRSDAGEKIYTEDTNHLHLHDGRILYQTGLLNTDTCGNWKMTICDIVEMPLFGHRAFVHARKGNEKHVAEFQLNVVKCERGYVIDDVKTVGIDL